MKTSHTHHRTKTGQIKRNPMVAKKLVEEATESWSSSRDFDEQYEYMSKAQKLKISKTKYIDLIEELNHWSLADWVKGAW